MALAQFAVVLALCSAAFGLLADTWPRTAKYLGFLLLGLSGAASVAAGVQAALAGSVQLDILPLGLPWLSWHLRLDSLAGFFLAVVGLGCVAVAFYGPGYVREFAHGRQPMAVLGVFTGLFVAGMQLVVLADDAFAFMVAWELMSLASYFLVTFQHRQAANRRAGFIYLLMAEIGALAILLAFGVLVGTHGNFTFDAMRHAHPSLLWGSIAFALALVGFGMKAGLVPLHVWLPEAHPVAPSHISALMSGVMLKVAIYGLIRFVFDLVGAVHWGWGVALLLVGAVSALYGILFALVQTDLKRMLAYSSVENVGIIAMALGLALVFQGVGRPVLASLALIAALYHALNHSVFKSLLFLGAGAVLQRSHERDLDRMGGLIRRMPQTAALFLVGAVSISALPPFNGFVSEWLLFQASLQAPVLHSGVLRSVIPVIAAMLALTGALAVACFVNAYGIGFLGQPRTRHVAHAREVDWGMRIAMGLLAVLCLVLGVAPAYVISALGRVTSLLVGADLNGLGGSWLHLVPVSSQTASYSAPLVVIGLLLAWGLIWLLLHPRGRRAVRRDAPWDCGFGPLSARMQYTSQAFSQPPRRVFGLVYDVQEQVEETRDPAAELRVQSIKHQLNIRDRVWNWGYLPVASWVQMAARLVGRSQTGHIRAYLSYSFVTLLFLLWWIT